MKFDKEKLKFFRLRSGMTQIDLAAKTSVSRQTIISLETGKTKQPLAELLTRLSEALGIGSDELFTRG